MSQPVASSSGVDDSSTSALSWQLGEHVTLSTSAAAKGALPQNFRVTKSVSVPHLVITGTGWWNLRQNRGGCSLVCRDTIIDGRIGINPVQKTISYSKSLPLPLAAFGSPVVTAEWRLGQPTWRPRLQLGIATDDGTTVVQPRPGAVAMRVRKPVYLTKRWGLEAVSLCTAATGDSMGSWGSGGGGGLSLDGFKLHLDLQEVNLLLRL